MNLRLVIRRLLALGIAAGLVIGPAAPITAAMPSAGTAMTMTAAGADDDAMQTADEMPCCPDQSKSKSCDGCPFVALCMLTVSLPVPSGAGILIERSAIREVFTAIDDLMIDGLAAKPPDYPPRTMV